MYNEYVGRFWWRPLSHLEKPIDWLVQHLQCSTSTTTSATATAAAESLPHSDATSARLEHDGLGRDGGREEGFRSSSRFCNPHLSQRKVDGQFRIVFLWQVFLKSIWCYYYLLLIGNRFDLRLWNKKGHYALPQFIVDVIKNSSIVQS